MTHVELQHITIGYGHRVLLEDVSAAIGGGRLVALLGRNGTGKSTLLRAVAGLEAPLSGGIRLCGRLLSATPAHELAQVVSFVTTEKVRIANLASRDVVGLGRAPYTDWLGRLRSEDRAVVDRALNLVGMGGFADKPMDRLSDGEAQRVMIARALAQDTPVILLDEPTAFLDMPNRYELCTLLRRLAHDEGKCIFFFDARTGHRADAVRRRRADRSAAAAPPAYRRNDSQRPYRTAFRQRDGGLRCLDAHGNGAEVTAE